MLQRYQLEECNQRRPRTAAARTSWRVGQLLKRVYLPVAVAQLGATEVSPQVFYERVVRRYACTPLLC